MRKIKALMIVLAICFVNISGCNVFASVAKDSPFSFSTIYNPTTHNFISNLPEILKILQNNRFLQIGVETGELTSINLMNGYECFKIYTFREKDVLVKLYIDDIIDPYGKLISIDIKFKSEAKCNKFLNEAVLMGFQEGEPFEGSVYYTYKDIVHFEYGMTPELYSYSIQVRFKEPDPLRDDKIFRLTPLIIAKLYQYDDIDLFSNGLARVCKAGKWGYIDLNGDEVIPCIYDWEVGRFSEGLALVDSDFDFKYNASKVKFIDNKGREIQYGNYYLPPKGNSIDATYEGLPIFYNGKCKVWTEAKSVFPNGNYEEDEILPVTINKKENIISIDDEDDFFEEPYLTEGYKINCYHFGYLTPIEKAYENEELTGSPYYIGRDTIPGGNGTSLVSLYLVDLTQPKISQLVEEMHGIMDYSGASTISPTNKINFESRARLYISRLNGGENKGKGVR